MANTTSLGYVPVDKSGDTMTGDLILNADPTAALQAATKQYVDGLTVEGDFKEAARVATTGNLTATYDNGASGVGATLTNSGAMAAISIDGVSLSANDRVLVKDQTSQDENGIYYVSVVGDGATNWVLTRSEDFDMADEMTAGATLVVYAGTANASTGWLLDSDITTIGTDNIVFSQLTAPPSSAAPSDATYIVQTANGTLTNEQALDTLSDGLLKHASGVVAQAVAGTDYLAPAAIGVTVQGYDAGLDSIAGLTTAANTLIYTTALDTYAVISAANSSVLVTSGAGVPSLSTAIPDGVTATTQSASDNSTKLATTAYVDNAISGGGHAPVGATYITQTPNGSLTNEQAMSTLATGLVKNTTTTGVQSIAVAGTDYLAPSAIGTTVQAYDAGLQSISGLTTTNYNLIYTTASDTYAVITPAASSVLVTNGSNVPSLSTAIPDGVTATTQTLTDATTKVATDAFVDSRVKLGQTDIACSSNTTYTPSINTNHYYKLTFTSSCTLAFTFNSGSAQSMCVELINAGGYTITWPASLEWAGGTEPTWTTTGRDIIVVWNNGDNLVSAALIGQDFS